MYIFLFHIQIPRLKLWTLEVVLLPSHQVWEQNTFMSVAHMYMYYTSPVKAHHTPATYLVHGQVEYPEH